MARWMVERWRNPPPANPPASTLPLASPSIAMPRAAVGNIGVTWVGHSTFVVQLGALNVLTDPMWSLRASPVQWAGPKRLVPPAVAMDALPPIDIVLLSHNHYDHLDVPTVRSLARRHPDATWLTPLGLSDFVRRHGVRVARELDWWEETGVHAATIGCAPAQHFSARGPGDRSATLWCGWTVAAGGLRLYFAGDTGYHPEFTRIGESFGPFDVSLLPIGAYEPRWFMRSVHMNADEAVQAHRDVSAAHPDHEGRRVMVGGHWGTFRLTDEAVGEPPIRAREAWTRAGLPPDDLWVLAHGETRVL